MKLRQHYDWHEGRRRAGATGEDMEAGMRAISLFSGVGGLDMGFERAGIETVLQAERDAWCNEVLARHWPETERVTDVRDVQGGDGIDLIYGGFPCQDVSVAGKRAGLGGERSGLWFEFERILRELRPRWAVIENVPGLLSSNKGRDFAVILDGLEELGYSVGWAVLDAQNFGVPQRRRRVFIVAGATGRSVEQVLSLCESCGGNPETSAAPGQAVAGTLGGGAGERGWSPDTDRMTFIPIQDAREVDKQQNGIGIGSDGDPMFTLDGASRHAVAVSLRGREGGGAPIVAYALNARDGKGINAGHGSNNLVAHPISASNAVRTSQRESDTTFVVAHALTAETYHHGGFPNQTVGADNGYMQADTSGVRRLTPLECERLMGWPDDWTRWTAGGKEIADSHRYRMAGNGVVASVAEWIGHRLVAVDKGLV